MLASTFVGGGLKSLRNPKAVTPPVVPFADRIPGLPQDPEQLARINSAVQIGAGTLLALGRLPRVSACALAASLVETTLAEHRYWTVEDDPEEKARQRAHFYKNVSLLGGLLIAAADTHGKPSLAHRTRTTAATSRRSLRRTTRGARSAAADSASHAADGVRAAADGVRSAADGVRSAAGSVRERLPAH
ncbi:hypothetical protein B1H18_01230 [Streptomyces tsukubensis]|uniref:DoxX family protein n=2 Tax=Streptomyces tsukubensis TaxID=83656 RepID=A0A1V4AGY1_9ACTN|nr:hypothetical protein B1H18_01230 [Streptomyces tsukubensis]